MGPNYPWSPPGEVKFTLSEVQEIIADVLRATPDEPLPEPPDDDWPDPDDNWPDEERLDDTFLPGGGPTLDEMWRAADPPDPHGVMLDTAVAMGAPSDADWLPDGMWMPDDSDVHVESAVTELPDDYYDAVVEPEPEEAPKPKRTYNTAGLTEANKRERQAKEDAVVQFLYDETDTTPGARSRLIDVHERYLAWVIDHKDRPHVALKSFRGLLDEVGYTMQPGRLDGDRLMGRPPILVHGMSLKERAVENTPRLPKVVIREPKQREKHALLGAKPGRELAQQTRELIEPLITEQGWTYLPHSGSGRGKPRVISPDGKTFTLPSSPHLSGRTLENTRTFLRSGGARL